MSPEELINLSMNYEVEIEPFTNISPINFLTFNFRGCSPLKPSKVPLYLAMHLKSLNLCGIRQPKYLTEEFLDMLIEKEKDEKSFCELPEFFFEHSYLFMSNEIESRICELKTLRMGKIWKGLAGLDGKALYVNGLSRWEFNEFKDIILETMKLGKEINLEDA